MKSVTSSQQQSLPVHIHLVLRRYNVTVIVPNNYYEVRGPSGNGPASFVGCCVISTETMIKALRWFVC